MATDQIRQMVNFILQEAHEKANEIRVKVGIFGSIFSFGEEALFGVDSSRLIFVLSVVH